MIGLLESVGCSAGLFWSTVVRLKDPGVTRSGCRDGPCSVDPSQSEDEQAPEVEPGHPLVQPVVVLPDAAVPGPYAEEGAQPAAQSSSFSTGQVFTMRSIGTSQSAALAHP